MDFTALELKLHDIKKKKLSLVKTIEKSRKELAGTVYSANGKWSCANTYAYHVFFDGEQLHVNIPEKKHLYVNYREKNVDFKRPPEYPIRFEKKKIHCTFNGIASQGLKVSLYLIGYKDGEKTNLFKIKINTGETLHLDTDDCYRMAIRIEGSGTFCLSGIQLDGQVIEDFGGREEAGWMKASSPQTKMSGDVFMADRFKKIINVAPSQLTVPSIFSNYINLENDSITTDIPAGRYAYLQCGEGALFERNDSELFQTINPENYYEFGFSSIGSAESELDLIIVGYDGHSPAEVKLIPNNTLATVKFNKSISGIKLLLRAKGSGTRYNVKIGRNDLVRKPIHEQSIPLKSKEWYAPDKSVCQVRTDKNNLSVSSNIKGTKTEYVSYQIKNLSFSKVPAKSAFEVEAKSIYELFIRASIAGGGTITPILITYSEVGKEEIISLKLNEINSIVFKETVVACRIAFKMNGTAELMVEEFSISQFPVIETSGDMEWIDAKETKLLGIIPPKELSSVKMAAIFDEFTTQCFAHECKLITFTPDNWKEVLEATIPDLLMVESAWRGNSGSWTKKVQYQNEESIADLKKLLLWCKERGIPTVFWNKEDPVHYNHFIETAKHFDFVLTTDSNMVPVYKEACGHERVDYLQFAAQPAIHNPITIGHREEALSFAGSYYAKHQERTEDMMKIFDAAIPFGLAIFDRNFEKAKQGLLPNNRFPEHIEPYIRGSLKYYEIDKAYKGFKAVININTVKNSPTMFARRVYESLASGTPIVSNYSEGLERLFGDIVCVSNDETEIGNYISKLFNEEETYRNIVLEGIRRVLSKDTYSHRLNKIIGMLELPFYHKKPRILAIGTAESIKEAEDICKSFERQTMLEKELCLLLTDEIGDAMPQVKGNSVYVFKESEFYSMYQNILEYSDFDYLAVLSPSYRYDSNYLMDFALSTLYAPWEVISLGGQDGLTFEQVYDISSETSIFRKDLLKLYSTKELISILVKEKDYSLLLKKGVRILSIPNNNQAKRVDIKLNNL